METGTLDLEGRGLTSLSPGLFEDARARSTMTRAKLSGNKLKVCRPRKNELVDSNRIPVYRPYVLEETEHQSST